VSINDNATDSDDRDQDPDPGDSLPRTSTGEIDWDRVAARQAQEMADRHVRPIMLGGKQAAPVASFEDRPDLEPDPRHADPVPDYDTPEAKQARYAILLFAVQNLKACGLSFEETRAYMAHEYLKIPYTAMAAIFHWPERVVSRIRKRVWRKLPAVRESNLGREHPVLEPDKPTTIRLDPSGTAKQTRFRSGGQCWEHLPVEHHQPSGTKPAAPKVQTR
jgi:hypothetical protein